MRILVKYLRDDLADSSYLGTLHEQCPKEFSLQTLYNDCPIWFTPAWDIEQSYKQLVRDGYSAIEAYEIVMTAANKDFERILDYYAEKWEIIGIVVTVEAEGVVLSREELWGVESDAPDLDEKEIWAINQAVVAAEDTLSRLRTIPFVSFNIVRET